MTTFRTLAILLLTMAFTAIGHADVPFKATTITADGEFAPTTTWYAMTIGTGRIRISDNNGADYITLSGRFTEEDENLWCFVGNDADGYLIYNKQAGPTKVLTSPTDLSANTGGDAYAVLKPTDAGGSTINRWDFRQALKTSTNADISVENGWFVCQHGKAGNILNNRSGKLAFWTGGYDNGSAIAITEPSLLPKDAEKQTDLFATDGSKPYPYRIPAIAKASNGRLIAVSDYRICGGDIGNGRVDLVARTSDDNGLSWGKEFTIKSGTGVSGTVDCGFGDPAIVADSESGEVLLISVCGNTLYGSATRQNPNRVARFRSHDNGATWTDYEEITEDIYTLFDASTMGPVKSLFFGSGRICQSRQVKVGSHYRLYAALCARDGGNRVIYSDDFGQTWHALGSINSSPAPQGDEPKCEELPDGTVVLSSRMNGGRYYNFFTYTNVATAQGAWGTVAASTADNKGTSAVGNSTNGEILILPAVRNADGAEVYVALQSVPFGSGRANVGIYWKELSSPADVKSPAAFAANWDGKHQASLIGSAYSTMIMQANDSIAFFYEEETYGRAYTNVYKQYSLEGLTKGAYTYRRTQSPASFVMQQLEEKVASATKNLEYGIAVGQVDETNKATMEQQIAAAVNGYVAAPTPQGYIDAQHQIDAAVENARVQIVSGEAYTLVNKLREGKYLCPSDEADGKEGKVTFGGADADYESARQLFIFESDGNGAWYIRNKATQTCLSATKATTKLFVTQETDRDNAGTYEVKPYKQGWSNVVCTNPANKTYAALNLNSSFRLIQSSNGTDAARWMVVPADRFTGIGQATADDASADTQLYDLQGRLISRAPRTGVYITSGHEKRIAR